MEISTWIKAFIDLSFPVAITIYLLVDVSKKLERVRRQMFQLTLGLSLILNEVGALQKYKDLIEESEKKLKGGDEDDPAF
jgi:hypothetical protein